MTGPKTDLWLVRTAGVLVTVVGIVLLTSGRRRRITAEVADGFAAAWALAWRAK